jgi:hypothetical protein
MTDYKAALQAWRSEQNASDHRGSIPVFAKDKPAQAGFIKKDPEHRAALARVRRWTRERFSLADDTTILVSEIACMQPGCPPVETVIVFWIDEQRHHFKIFKPVVDVLLDDLPFAWMRDALAVPDGFECDCC